MGYIPQLLKKLNPIMCKNMDRPSETSQTER